jgi:MotA/TolQ/ExbB proton channel family protein
MIPKQLFLRWSLMASLIAVFAMIAASLGWFGIMYKGDFTRLTVITIGVLAAATAWCGALAWKVDRARAAPRSPEGLTAFVKRLENDAEHGWFAINLCEQLGLLGTVFGFVAMLIDGFGGVTAGNQQAIQELLERLSSGMATAFLTTLVGYLCSIALRFQYHMLDRAVQGMKP